MNLDHLGMASAVYICIDSPAYRFRGGKTKQKTPPNLIALQVELAILFWGKLGSEIIVHDKKKESKYCQNREDRDIVL